MITDIDSIALDLDSEISKWNGAKNPIVYFMQRKDFLFDQINNNGGFMQLQINGVNVSASFVSGDVVYVQSDDQTHDLVTTVSASTFSAGNTLVTLAATYVSNPFFGFVNNETLRKSYRVEVELYNSSDVKFGSTYIFSPNYKGLVKVDVSAAVKNEMMPDIQDMTGIDYTEDVTYKEFYIKYREVWTGSAESQIDDSANHYFGVFGAKQIPAQYGGNYYDYITYNDSSPKGKFITKLTRPKVWRGYPFLISCIIGDNVTDTVMIVVSNYDINGANINSAFTTAAVETGKKLLINATEINPIHENAHTYQIRVNNTATFLNIIDALVLDVVDPCQSSVMLLGRNSLGGILQFMFDYNQDKSYEYNNGKYQTKKLYAKDLTDNEWEALHDFMTVGDVYKDNITELTPDVIKTSSRIDQQVYVLNEDGTKVGVIARSVKNSTRTMRIKHQIQLEIEMPEIL